MNNYELEAKLAAREAKIAALEMDIEGLRIVAEAINLLKKRIAELEAENAAPRETACRVEEIKKMLEETSGQVPFSCARCNGLMGSVRQLIAENGELQDQRDALRKQIEIILLDDLRAARAAIDAVLKGGKG